MKRLILMLAAVVVLTGGWARAQPERRGGRNRWAVVGEVLKKYGEEDPKGHAELIKLRETDREAFRRKVGQLIREAASKDPELKKRLARARGGGGARSRVPETVKVVCDIVYAKYGEREVQLDLYLPKKPPAGKLPCIVVVHGGGWRSGNKERFARLASAFAEKGFAAACIGYRLIPEVQVRQCVEDAKASVRWVRANAAKHNIDADRLGAFGGSAGAHLAAMLGTSFKAKQLEGTGGNDGVSSRVHAVVGMATPADLTAFGRRRRVDEETAKLISPAAYVDSDSARFLLMHAKGDRVVPYSQATGLLAKLKKANVPAKLIPIKGGGHAFWNGTTPVAAKALADSIQFFDQALKSTKPKAATPTSSGPK